MSHVSDYRALAAKHTAELRKWIDSDPSAKKKLENHIGNDRSLEGYLDEYSHKFAIAYYLACDLGYPQQDRMREEITPFEDLEEMMS